MTEQDFKELFRNLYVTVGLTNFQARLAATWVLAARGFVADRSIVCRTSFLSDRRRPRGRDRAVRLVAASVEDLLVELAPRS